MRKNFLSIAVIILLISLVVIGCSKDSAENNENSPTNEKVESTETTKSREVVEATNNNTEEKSKKISATANNTENTNNETEKQEEKKQKSETVSWNGFWGKVQEGAIEKLEISKDNGKTFHMNLTIAVGGDYIGVDGEANVNGNTATFVDQWHFRGCELILELKADEIHIKRTDNCSETEEIGEYFAGDYKKVPIETYKKTLSSMKVVSEIQDSEIQILLGKDYNTLVQNMKNYALADEKYGAEDNRVVEGKTAENKDGAILIMDPFGRYYIGNVVNGKIRYYTNDEVSKDTPHSHVSKWSNFIKIDQIENF
jgi:hypothetical protein